MACRDIIGRASIEDSRFSTKILAEIVDISSCLGLDYGGETDLSSVIYRRRGLVNIEGKYMLFSELNIANLLWKS